MIARSWGFKSLLRHTVDMSGNWDSLIYFFSVGGIFFVIGFWLPFHKKDVRWSRRVDRKTIQYILGGLAFYLLVYLLWQIHAVGWI